MEVTTSFKRMILFLAFFLSIFYALYRLYNPLIVPIGIGIFLTYLLNPVVHRYGTSRKYRILIAIGMVSIVVGGFALGIIKFAPKLYGQSIILLELLPEATEAVIGHWLPSIREFVVKMGLVTELEFDENIRDMRLLNQLTSQIQQALTNIWRTAPDLLGGVINVVLVPFITFFLLIDSQKVVDAIVGLVPRDLRGNLGVFVTNVDDTLKSVIKGQLTVAFILGVLYVIGFSLIGLQLGFAIGVIAGICRIIPYFDVVVGGVLASIVILYDFSGFHQVASVAAVFVIVQTLDGLWITPTVIGEKVGIHPAIIVCSVLSFADLFGFWGVLMAIPTIAVSRTTLISLRPIYLRKFADWQPIKPNANKAFAHVSKERPTKSRRFLKSI